MHDDAEIERLRIPVDDYSRRSEDNLARVSRRVKAGAARPATRAPIESAAEYAPQVVHVMVTGEPRIDLGNVRNDGLIAEPAGRRLRRGAVPGRRRRRAADAVGALPPQCAALNRTFLYVVELTVRAALEGRPDHVRHAAMLDPNAAATLTLDEIDALCDELTRGARRRAAGGIRD